MKFATWNLRPINDTELDGPEATIAASGGSASAIWNDGPIEAGATTLGKFEGEPGDLSAWNFTEVSLAEATAFITDNFTPFELPNGDTVTLEEALTVLD